MATSSKALSLLLSVCYKCGLEHIKYNNTKSNVMIFSCKRFNDIHMSNIVLNDETLPRFSKCKYLGHITKEQLSDNNDMSRIYPRVICLNPNGLHVYRICKIYFI